MGFCVWAAGSGSAPGTGSSRLTPQYGQKLTLGPDPQLKAIGIPTVRASLALHFGHFTSRCIASIAPAKSRIPSAGNAATGMVLGKFFATTVVKGNSSQPQNPIPAHQYIRRLM